MKSNNVFIEDLKKSYDETIKLLDEHTGELIKNDSNLTAIIKFGDYINNIQGIYDTLKNFYSLIYNSKTILEHFKSSKQNVRQLPLTSILKNDSLHPNDIDIYRKELNKNYNKFIDEFDNFKDDEFYEFFVHKLLSEAGYNKTHWFFSNTYINECEFMLDFLLDFVEENYNPVGEEEIENEDINHNDRYISKAVKVAVWRRDRGKCVQCGSQDKLEYDHIIPVSKGGSNTERNIQLLCEKCNRKKSNVIQ